MHISDVVNYNVEVCCNYLFKVVFVSVFGDVSLFNQIILTIFKNQQMFTITYDVEPSNSQVFM